MTSFAGWNDACFIPRRAMGRRLEKSKDESTSDHRCAVVARGQVIAAPRQRLVRRSLEGRNGWVVSGRYRVNRALGTGGMGSVYEATDLETGLDVALKVLHSGAYDAARLKRFRREAASAMAVKSDHVCRVHYLGVDRGTPFIVMDRLQGETVHKRLVTDGPFSPGEAVAIMLQLLDALSATHAAGILHRDVKPGNVFLTSARGETPRVKLIDFGLAKPIRQQVVADPDQPGLAEITPSDGVPGTLHFLAPEQLLGAGGIDQRVDVYAAGLTFFELLTARRPYEAASREDVMRDILLADPPKVTTWRPELPTLFDDVIAMATAKSPERRFASAEAFKRAILAAWKLQAKAPIESGICPAMEDDDDSCVAIQVDLDDECPTLRPPPCVREAWVKPIPGLRPLPRDLRDETEE